MKTLRLLLFSPSNHRWQLHLVMDQNVSRWRSNFLLSIRYLQTVARLSGSCALQIPLSEFLHKGLSPAINRLWIQSRSNCRPPVALALSLGHWVMRKRVSSPSRQPRVSQPPVTHWVAMLFRCFKKKASVYRLVFCIVWSPSSCIISIEFGETIWYQVEVTVSCGPAICEEYRPDSYPHGMYIWGTKKFQGS